MKKLYSKSYLQSDGFQAHKTHVNLMFQPLHPAICKAPQTNKRFLCVKLACYVEFYAAFYGHYYGSYFSRLRGLHDKVLDIWTFTQDKG